MKKVVAVLFVVTLAFTMVSGCATDPATGKKSVDWSEVGKYYSQYVMGFAVPVGSVAAVAVAPETAPLVALASVEASKLNDLIVAKASGDQLAAQQQAVQIAIDAVNAAVKK